MAVDRFLGAGWASVHAPADPRAMLLWTLDLGFRGLLAAPAPRAVDWPALVAARGSLPFRFGGARVSAVQGEVLAEAGLASLHAGDQAVAQALVDQTVGLARRLGSGQVLLEPGRVQVSGEVAHTDLCDRGARWTPEAAKTLLARRDVCLDRALDRLCRALHQLCTAHPDTSFCLSLSRDVLGLGEPRALRAVFEDLNRFQLGYWHDTVAAASREQYLDENPGRALDELSKYLQGMTLGDFCGSEAFLPPGSGGVDYPLLSAYRLPTNRTFPVVIELDPGVSPGDVAGIHAHLSRFGL